MSRLAELSIVQWSSSSFANLTFETVGKGNRPNNFVEHTEITGSIHGLLCPILSII